MRHRKWFDIATTKPKAGSDVWGWSRTLNRASVYYVGARPADAVKHISHWMPLQGRAPLHAPSR